MAVKITKGDMAILTHIAGFKILTVEQLSAITQRSSQVVRRRLRVLADQKLIFAGKRAFGKGPGPREYVIVLTEMALELLNSNGILSLHAACETEKTIDPIFIDHDLLVNWFFIHALNIQKIKKQFKVQFLMPSSHPPRDGEPDKPLLMERVSANDGTADDFSFFPDGVLSISHQELGKTLLFFLEADMGTEPLVNTKRAAGDIRHKILGYQALFRSGRYKRYGKRFQAELNGFRLLFLSNEPGRMKALCDLAQNMPPSDFIWATTRNQMFSNGITGKIWARGGRYKEAPQSILGKLTFDAACLNSMQ